MPDSETKAGPESTAGGDDDETEEPEPRPSAIRIPIASAGEQIGLGDVLKRATTAAHVKPCSGCQQRAQLLNRWVAFTPRRPRR